VKILISRKIFVLYYLKKNKIFEIYSASERRYNRVKRWLRDVDIFSKDYLIIPINQNAHWYIVLIQNHNNVLTEGDLMSDDEDEKTGKI